MNELLPSQSTSPPPDDRSGTIELPIHLVRQTCVETTPSVLRIAAMFGLGIDEQRTMTILPPTTITLPARSLTFITGPSGGGKSSLLKQMRAAALQHDDITLTDFATLADLPDRPLIDCFCALSDQCAKPDMPDNTDANASMRIALRWLNTAGLSDAFVWLRRPRELSDGQRYRAAIAHAMAMIEKTPRANTHTANATITSLQHLLLADEFGASLDRVTAKIVARQLRRWIDRSPVNVAMIVATTHDDLLESLRPDVLIEKPLGESMRIHYRG